MFFLIEESRNTTQLISRQPPVPHSPASFSPITPLLYQKPGKSQVVFYNLTKNFFNDTIEEMKIKKKINVWTGNKTRIVKFGKAEKPESGKKK